MFTNNTAQQQNSAAVPNPAAMSASGMPIKTFPAGAQPMGQAHHASGQPISSIHDRDMNRDGIPDRLQQGGGMMGQPTSFSDRDMNRDGIPDRLQQGGGVGGMMGQPHLAGSGFGQPPIATISGPDMNRDGIPDQLQQGGGMIGGLQTMQSMQPTAVQVIQHQTAVHEVIKPSQLQEVQPVISREINRTEVHQITQPIMENNVLPTQYQDRVLPTQIKPDVILGGPAPAMAQEQSSRVVEATQRTTMVHRDIVEETIRGHIIEEIQPVVYREVIAPSIIRETQNITEHIFEAPIVTHETRAPIIQTGQPMSGGASYVGAGYPSGGAAPFVSTVPHYNAPLSTAQPPLQQQQDQQHKHGLAGILHHKH